MPNRGVGEVGVVNCQLTRARLFGRRFQRKFGKGSPSEQLLELFGCETCVVNNAPHRISVNRIVPGDSEDSGAIRHDNVFALANDAKSRLLQGSHSIKVIYTRNLAMSLHSHIDRADLSIRKQIIYSFQVLVNCVPNVL